MANSFLTQDDRLSSMDVFGVLLMRDFAATFSVNMRKEGARYRNL
jgi:hypothetical protein